MFSTQLQRALMGAYRLVLRTGLLHTRWGYAALERCYDVYKANLEATWLDGARELVPAGSTVVDVGAHVGFFTRRFAAWVGEHGHVFALEPEPLDFGRLCSRVERNRLTDRVTTLNVAAAESSDQYHLRVDPEHPGDHQLADSGLAIRGVTLDEVLASRGWPAVSLIKLDIQGAETRALRGAKATLERLRPALLVEIDEERLVRQGSSTSALLDLLQAGGYAPRRIDRLGISSVVDCAEVLGLARAGGYVDLVFIPSESRR